MASAPKQPPTAKVSDVIGGFIPTRKFPTSTSNPSFISSIDFDDTGELALIAQDDDILHIYNCKEGKHAKELKSQKYGADIARFGHHPQSIIYASTKHDDNIRYLSSHDNSYVRYFRGHTAAVTCITLDPSNDTFLSASLDNTVRLWDLRSSTPQAQLNLTAPYLVAYDPTATVLAIGCPAAQSVLLYDVRNYDKSPFATFDLEPAEAAFSKASANSSNRSPWTKLEFSNDGKKLLVATTAPASGHYILDAFEGDMRAFLPRPNGPTNRVCPAELGELRSRQQAGRSNSMHSGPGTGISSGQGDACITPDGRFVIGGSGEYGLCVWDLDDGPFGSSSETGYYSNKASDAEKVLRHSYEIGSKTAGMASVVSYNPRYNLLATADKALVFWQPDAES